MLTIKKCYFIRSETQFVTLNSKLTNSMSKTGGKRSCVLTLGCVYQMLEIHKKTLNSNMKPLREVT